METAKLKKFAQFARRSLIKQISAKLELVLTENSAAQRESVEAIKKLKEAIKSDGSEQVIERVAYTWFNRFCALRFMDVNRYNQIGNSRLGVVSPAEGQFQPEILAEAKSGHIEEEMLHDNIRQQIFALLEGKSPSRDPQGEAYRLLVVGACNYWHRAMPFLFERIDDFTELLMPDDLLSGNSILAYTREAMTPDACKDVEVIGWLYQFYISEKKDEVINRRSVVTKDEIPAATQLFTPKWIVEYIVENSLGRLWMLNRPNSKLAEKMDYFIKSEQDVTDFLRIKKPEEIKICDPACGSGHILTYAFDLLYAIYEEEGYDPHEISEKILANNLYGIEIDERARELAAFALTMKALQYDKRFFYRATKRGKFIEPNVCLLQNIHFDENELNDYMDFVGRDLFTLQLQATLKQFEESDNFGSLIRPEVTDVAAMMKILEAKNVSGQLFHTPIHEKVLQLLHQADYLSPKYHVVIANPPYMGTKAMNVRLKSYLKDHYPDVKSDLFAAFIMRNKELTLSKGQLGFVTPFVWMFISSFENLRQYILDKTTITSLVQLEYNAFAPACIPVSIFTLENGYHSEVKGSFVRLSNFRGSENQAPKTLEAIKNHDCGWFYRVCAANFKKIPGSPIAYWVSDSFREIFQKPPLAAYFQTRLGLSTANNDRFLRNWQEVSHSKIGFGVIDRHNAQVKKLKWFPYEKGGAFRKWYGNHDFIVNWENDGYEIRDFGKNEGRIRSHNYNLDYIFKDGITWSDVTSGSNAFRYMPQGYLFDGRGSSGFVHEDHLMKRIFGFLNSKISTYAISAINPSLAINVGEIAKLPFPDVTFDIASTLDNAVHSLVDAHKADWDSYETSWDFTSIPLLQSEYLQPKLKSTYNDLRAHWRNMALEMQRLEEKNNRIFIDAYGLQAELNPEVPLNEITLTCNPHYRYSNSKNAEELEVLLRADTMKEFISYAVGCMFGRYSLDKPGLILANQGETIEDYWKNVRSYQNLPTANCPLPTDSIFLPDADNVIPILDGDWFTDDISERFRQFLRITFGIEHYEENLKFIEQALGKDVRKYFLKDFYNDHVRRYKKRPIYWLFSTPKGSFNALIYMHRYRSDTVSVVLNYLREFRIKLTTEKNHLEAVSISASASPGEKTKALKEIESIRKMVEELDSYEREILYPLATEQLEIDLDDGVKVNYQKFGPALRKIPGLDNKEE